MDGPSNEVEIARLQVKVSHLEHQLSEMMVKLDQVLSALAEAKGGWRTMMWLGGAASAVGATIAWVVSHLSFRS